VRAVLRAANDAPGGQSASSHGHVDRGANGR